MFTNYNLKNIIPELYLYPNHNPNSTSTQSLHQSHPQSLFRSKSLNNCNSSINRGINLNFNPLNLLLSELIPQNSTNYEKIPQNNKKINIDTKNVNFNDEEINNIFNSRAQEGNKLQSIIYKIKNIIKEKDLNNVNHLVQLVCYYFIHEFNDIEYGTLNELKVLIRHYFSIKNIDEQHLINTILDIIKIKHQTSGKKEYEYVYNVYLLHDIESKLVKKLSLEIYDWLLSLNNHSNSTSYPLNKSKQQQNQLHNYSCQPPQQTSNNNNNLLYTYPLSYQKINIPPSTSTQTSTSKNIKDDNYTNIEKKIDSFITKVDERISLMEENIDTIISQIKEILNYKNDKEYMQNQIDDINWVLNEIIGSDLTSKIKHFKDCIDSNCNCNNISLKNENENECKDKNIESIDNNECPNTDNNNNENINLVIEDVHSIADSIVDEIIKSCN